MSTEPTPNVQSSCQVWREEGPFIFSVGKYPGKMNFDTQKCHLFLQDTLPSSFLTPSAVLANYDVY